MNQCYLTLSFYFWFIIPNGNFATAKQPNIVFILADDLGFNDVSYHGSTGVKTPNIDQLAREGTVFTRHYTQPVCTPSRGALMTSKYAIHLGLQNGIISPPSPHGLPLEDRLMPQYLKDLGYDCHAVGKWHLGFYKTEYLPTKRGFDTFFGYYGGKLDYFDHTNQFPSYGFDGLDFRYDRGNFSTDLWSLFGQYSTDLFAIQAKQLIKTRDTSKPLFLYLPHQGVHSPVQGQSFLIQEFDDVWNSNRRDYLTQVLALDRAVGTTVQALKDEGIFEETLIVFSSDNGAPAGAGSNYPLRGLKNYNFEGGVRTPAFIRGPKIDSEYEYKNLFHLVDWMPTLYEAAGGNASDLATDLDGISQWKALSGEDANVDDPPRSELLINIQKSHSEYAIISGDYKFHLAPNGLHSEGSTVKDKWYHYKGPFNETDTNRVFYQDGWKLPVTECNVPDQYTPCNLTSGGDKYCLFDIIKDPCEYNNIAAENPETVQYLKSRLQFYKDGAVTPFDNKADPESNPALHGNVWRPWRDNENDYVIRNSQSHKEGRKILH